MALNNLGSVVLDVTSFYSNNVVADIPSSEVTFTLNKATTVIIIGSARYILSGDEIPLDGRDNYARFGFDIDGTDYEGVIAGTDILGSTQGYSYFPATFVQAVSLLAGNHTVKLWGKTQNGTVTGLIAPPIRLTVLG